MFPRNLLIWDNKWSDLCCMRWLSKIFKLNRIDQLVKLVSTQHKSPSICREPLERFPFRSISSVTHKHTRTRFHLYILFYYLFCCIMCGDVALCVYFRFQFNKSQNAHVKKIWILMS